MMNLPAYGSSPDSDPDPRRDANGEWSVEERLREQAVANLSEKASFRRHLLTYVLVNTMLVVIWLIGALSSGEWFPWFLFPLMGWGIGIASHAWKVYGDRPPTEELIRTEMRRISGS